MAEFEPEGYDDLRSYVRNNWNWIALVNSSGTEQIRLDINSSADVTIISDETSNPLTVEIEITGSQLSGSLPQTLSEGEVYKTSGATTVMAQDTYTDATLEASNDTIIVTHDYELPQV